MSFLAIQSIDTAPGGLSYLPQKCSYLSLLAALASIVMGLAVRSPRLFVSDSQNYYSGPLFKRIYIDQSWSILLPSHDRHPGFSVRTLPV